VLSGLKHCVCSKNREWQAAAFRQLLKRGDLKNQDSYFKDKI
jgi:hypothetical protein